MIELPLSTITLGTGFGLLLIGLWGMLVRKNIIRMVIGFSLIDTGIHMIMVSLGYIRGGTAPIIDAAVDRATALTAVVDPVPSALVLTAIVIGLGITAVMLAYAVQIHTHKKTLSIDDCTDSKW
ncbi:MAG: cation:proton antiporter subunit C [Chromatiaceae bacterium]|jgi:multicomponent Na+:H+ antiporter subunit C|nr:cation:proton antiporter subunit C [Chromatiaceae bacterium]